MANFRTTSGGEILSVSTRRILKKMDETQVKNAMKQFKRVELQRNLSRKMLTGVDIKTMGEIERQFSTKCIILERDEQSQEDEDSIGSSNIEDEKRCGSDAERCRRTIKCTQTSSSNGRGGERRRITTSGQNDFHCESSKEIEESDEEHEEGEPQSEGSSPTMINEVRQAKGREEEDNKRFFDSMGVLDQVDSGDFEEDEEAEAEGEGPEQQFSNSLGALAPFSDRGDECDDALDEGGSMKGPRKQLLKDDQKSEMWKPLSSNQRDPKYDDDEDDEDDDEEDDTAKKNTAADKVGNGIGRFWNNLRSSYTAGVPQSNSKPARSPRKQASPRKETDGATFFRRGKRKSDKYQFLHAVALYNFALIRQREEFGHDHVDCATTLNEIGFCWMMLGERYPALTALEESLYIRQRVLGDGAMEVAETTDNIWMILHDERLELEGLV